MAQLTPFSKIILSVTILAVVGAAAWHLGIKKLVQGSGEGDDPSKQAAAPKGGADAISKTPVNKATGALGSATNPIKVSIVSFHGYAPAFVANGKSLSTLPGSIYDQLGVNVQFVIQDNVPTLTEIYESGTAHCAWRTSDFWAQEQPNLRNSGHDGRAVLIVDNTQGGDAVIAKDPAIQKIEDLADKKVALLQFTPSHGMLIDAVENSSLTARKKQSVKSIFVNAEEGTAGVRAAFESGNVDGAVLWDPDLSLALRVPGSHVVYSTATATNLIFDVMVCDQRYLKEPANEAPFQNFVAGWLKGVDVSEKNPDEAVDALVKTEEMFQLIEKQEGRPFIRGLLKNLDWTGLSDNVRILGLAGGTNHYERVYRQFDGIYRSLGALANPNSPVINPSESFDYRFVKALQSKDSAATQAAAVPQYQFSEAERAKVETAAKTTVTKPVTVNFGTGSAELTKRAQKTIDEEMVPMIENNGSAYFEVSGNTDSTGARATNMKLSKQRAQGVVDYLVAQWEFPRQRFTVSGNGPDKPICNEKNPESEGVTLEDCRGMNRATRLAVMKR